MARALLINPSYFRTYGSNEGGIAFPVYPVLGLGAIGGSLRSHGHDVEILDLSYRVYDPDVIRKKIREMRPDIVGVTATTPLANQMRDISYLVKDVSPEILTIAGGAHPSALPEESMQQSALDYVASGEADHVMSHLLNGESDQSIGGLVWRDGSRIVSNTQHGLVDDLDDLPFPSWDAYPPESNDRITKIIARHRPVMTVEFSRGCIYRCDFCGSKNTMGRGYRKKSPERCAEEMQRLASLGFREAVLVDDIFTSDNEWAAEVCEALIRADTGMAWTCTNGIRVDSANTELFDLMKRAGCYRVYFGFESGNEEVLKSFGKGGRATLDQGVSAVRMARKAGLEPNGFFMVGLTGDTEDTMQDTIDYARKVELDTMKCGMTVPFPGTPMFHELDELGLIKSFDWDDYTVYNRANTLYDHPSLDWDTITSYFNRFYREAYLQNPRYLMRRLWFMVKNHEFFWNVWYTLKFSLMMFGKGKPPETEQYEYEDQWRPLDLTPGRDRLEMPAVPRASKVQLAGRRNNVVSVSADPGE